MLFGLGAHLRDQALADERRRHRVFVLMAVFIDAHVLERLGIADPVPDEIVAAVPGPQVVVEPRDRVADDLLALGQEEHEVGKYALARRRGEGGLGRRAAPDVIAGIDRLHFGRDLCADGGTDAVAAHQQIGALDAAIGEMDTDPFALRLDALERMTEVVVRGIDRLAQQPLQPVPGGQDLPQRSFADDAAVAVDGDAFRHLDAEIARAGAALLQRVQQFRMGGDAGATAHELDRRAFEHVDIPADPAQERRGEQARHGAADDDGAPAAPAGRGCHGPPAR